ncbi:MAG: hypothetical protein ACOYWZ_04540 [Bacillota bacterium]
MKCQICGKEFEPNKYHPYNAKVCSQECRKKLDYRKVKRWRTVKYQDPAYRQRLLEYSHNYYWTYIKGYSL